MLNLNLQKYLAGMPIRYTLRSTRTGPALKSGGEPEPITFATIEFQLVDA